MIIDTQNELSDAQLGTAIGASAISTNVIDLFSVTTGAQAAGFSPNTRIDIGDELYLVVNTVAAATDTSSDATLTVTLESADNEALSTNPIVHFSTGAMAFATFSPAGTNLVRIRLPKALYRRYLGVRYTVASGPLTAGSFDAVLTPNVDSQRAYRSGYVVQ